MLKTFSKWVLVSAVLFTMPAAHCEWYIGVGAGVSAYDIPGDLEEIFGGLDELTDEIDSFPGIGATFEFEDEDTGVKIFAGIPINPNLAVEFGYVDLGETTVEFTMDSDGTSAPPGMTSISSSISVDGFNAAVVGSLPVSDSVSLNGRVGVYLWDVEAEFNSVDTTGEFFNDSFSVSDDGNDIYYGLGLDVGWLRLFYEIYDIDGDDINLAGVAVRFGFE